MQHLKHFITDVSERVVFFSPEGCVFLSKYWFNTSSAWGVNDVRRFLFFDGSLPMKSVRFCTPFLYRSSASLIHRSSTGLIFWALFGVMSSFSNLKHPMSTKLLAHIVAESCAITDNLNSYSPHHSYPQSTLHEVESQQIRPASNRWRQVPDSLGSGTM